ncbi:conserved hypothetical protein [Thermosinus carboxydivorans Nor1]|uniref:Uncharacterized protein n=1 Tax=Thermosinus carboxydivorans Nor1 TaxID=401526 RepID=A1HPH7_9FIRM|nr:hypothetical protein [Thermosinus carboxydivorans]EAX47952.1 conserved hypothetical protein [Thermosinus carboxydivorans Nor1]
MHNWGLILASSSYSSVTAINWLAKQGEFFTTAEIDILALSLNNQTVVEVGGGVIGSPFERVQSARGEMEFIKENICIVSYPGGPGLALIGINEEAIKKFKGIISKIEKEKPKIDKMLDLIAETPVAAAIIILDGCGTSEMGGGLYIKEINLKKVYYLPYDKVSGYFNLEIYLRGC